jgi:hypothetical protein
MLNQKESIFQAVTSVLEESGQTVTDGQAVELTQNQKKTVIAMIAQSFHSGDTEMKESAREKYDTVEKLESKYVPGLLNNWLRKDTRLNGGVKYQAKNPGSRQGSSDPVIRELKKLLANVDDEQKEAVQAEIDKRLGELKELQAEKRKQSIDASKLPEHLRHLAS